MLYNAYREMTLRLPHLRDRDIAQPKIGDLARPLQLGERPELVLKRRSRIIRVQQQRKKALYAERFQAAVHSLPQVIRPAVRNPLPPGTRQAHLGENSDLL